MTSTAYPTVSPAVATSTSTSCHIPSSPMHVDEDKPPLAAVAAKVENDKKGSSVTPSSPPFHRDQRVWAQDPVTARYYHSTVRDLRWDNHEWKFLIHYHGWNQRWDRFVTADHMANLDQAQALRAAGLLSEDRKEQDDAENEESAVNATTTTLGSNRKRKTNSNDSEPSKTSTSRKRRTARNRKLLPFADQCELPITLQTVLVEEWERLTRPHNHPSGQAPVRLVHSLPASVTVHQVLKHFAKKKQKEESQNPESITAFCNGLNQLFQVALPKCLLYNQERPQYQALLKDPVLSQKPLTEIYGCEYLLRLYVRLPFLLPTVDESTSSCLVGPLLSELLVLMQKNRQACFKGDYRRPFREEWLEQEVKKCEESMEEETTTA